ncbi:MAG: aminotransferase class V-fold PLP-dependent enzyme [Anaerolineae bacterium]|nr:aminotransferase class V-fold PLP-dependent enzyme [Anaerolineae bacterium]
MVQSRGPSRYPEVDALRAAFPVTKHCTYLNHAAIAPLSGPVRAAMSKFVADSGVIFGRESRYEHISNDLRAVLAWLINAAPEEIAFVQNTGSGINIIANALPLQDGDNVIFCDIEFPSNVYPWMNLRRKGVEARCVPNDGGGLTIDALERYADARTRVVAASSVEFLTGFKNDLQELGIWCREHGAYFVVDAIQSLGAAPLDVQACQIDFLACGGPKWLMGPLGLGFIYCRHELLDDLAPPFAGSLSVVGWEDWRDYNFTFLPDARRFEIGTENLIGQVGLLAAVRFLMEAGIQAIERWTLHLTDLLIEDLQRRGYHIASNLEQKRRSAIVSFDVPGDVDKAFKKLTGAKVVVSKRERHIRVSPHCYNTEAEIARVGDILGNAH